MAVKSKVAKQESKPITGIKGFNSLINADFMRVKINQMVGRTDAQQFITSITSAVNNNPTLAECDAQSIISAALQGQSFHLPCSPQLGYFYMVPYNNKNKDCKEAQFQMGYKGYIQLALKSGQYLDIDVLEIREGEYLGRDKMTGKPKFEFIEDDEERENLPVVGYMAYFESKDGYTKRLYWSKEKVINHADKYSQAFSKNGTTVRKGNYTYTKVSYKDYLAGNYDLKTEWLYSSFWYKNFDVMAGKTVLKQLLSRYALLSTELQKAFEVDQAVLDKDMNATYIDNENIIEGAATEKEDVQPQQTIEQQPSNTFGQQMSQAPYQNVEIDQNQLAQMVQDNFDPMGM